MWKEGLFMMPQHLQQMDAYHERQLSRRIEALGGNVWGVAELEVDEDDLARGIFSVNRCTAVMPDGLMVEVGPEHPLKALTAMTPSGLAGGAGTVAIHLAVPAAEVGGATRDGEEAGGARFLVQPRSLADQYGAAQDAEVECVVPNARLLFGHDNLQSFVTFKLAELAPDAAGQLALRREYIPPCLRIETSPFIVSNMSRLVAAMGTKQKDLVAKYGDRTASIVEFGAADLSTFFFLHTINQWLPVFTHYADAGSVHPEVLYLALAAFAGQLSSFEPSTDPLTLPRFSFKELSSTFVPLFEIVFRLLGTVVSSRYHPIPLVQKQPGLFVGQVDDPQLLRAFALYLIVGGDLPEETLRNELPRYVKVGSIEQISQIVHSALPGVGVRIDFSPPAALPVRAHMVYLQLEKQGRYWSSVTQSGTIAIYQPVKPESVKLELVAVE
jgi:type VI secretion system protein ImpJ